jgi:hypothetical protein
MSKKNIFSLIAFLFAFIGLMVWYWSSVGHNCESQKISQAKFEQFFVQKNTGIYLAKIREGRWADVFSSQDFVSIYENSCPYMPGAMAVISDQTYDEGEKIKALILMQSLPPTDYFSLAKTSLSLYQQSKISKPVLEFVFMPYLDLNQSSHQLVFWHPNWRRQLREAEYIMLDKDFSKNVQDKLNGKTFLDWFETYVERKR